MASRMICLLKGNELYIRAQNWTENEDFVWKCLIVNDNWWSGNHYFNIEAAYTCPSDHAPDRLDGLTLWKEAHDDICPLSINDTYVGANHGMNCLEVITAPNHGKTNDDIGSVWLDAQGQTYCLVQVINADKLGFVMFDEESMSSGIMRYGKPEGVLTHKENALHTEDVIIAERAGSQLRPCYNHYSLLLTMDGEVVDPYSDCLRQCDCLRIQTVYDVIYIPAMLRYLMENVGKNDNSSMHAELLRERYVRISVCYDFHENGSTSVYSSYEFQKDVEVNYLGLVQSMTVAEKPYAYVPDTVYDVLTQQDETQKFHFTKDTWRDPEKVPYRYYQFKDTSCKDGMALVYDREYGGGDNEMRLAKSDRAGYYNSTRKQYPAFISGGKLEAGTRLNGFAARVPICKRDPDLTAVCWYHIGENIILMIDTHKTIDKDIALPEFMADRTPEILDSKGVLNATLENGKLHVRFDGYGYLVLRL